MRFPRKMMILAGVTVLSTGCSLIGQKTLSDKTLARKAAFALNTTADQVSISERETDGLYAIAFNATVKEKKYQCYVTTAIAITSDAICAGTDGSAGEVQCNALLKAAGRC